MLRIFVALMALSVPTLVLAHADCTANPQSEWRSSRRRGLAAGVRSHRALESGARACADTA